ncbi:MAG: GNAT family N-acetyltransferase [Lachnospiraceae bacterium]|nr:GNAT family N-acetyltransferase [Lachnospiraceae bacterium]
MSYKGDYAGTVFVENEQYALRFLQDSDKDDFMRTQIQNSNIPRAYEMDGFAEYVWKSTPEDNEWIFCIIEKATDSYNGFCNLRYIDTLTPEIGINLPKEFQCMGIGYQALTLLMRTYQTVRCTNYFIAKVRSDNTHSQHLMDKLHAVQTGREDSEFKQAIRQLTNLPSELKVYEVRTKAGTMQDENYILVYHIKPEF